MTTDDRPRVTWAVRLAGTVATLIGGFWVAAWMVGVAREWSTGSMITPKTNNALALLLGGLALVLLAPKSPGRRRRLLIGALGGIVLLLGGLTLSQHLGGWDLGIDQILATEAPGAAGITSPNRMGPPASTCHALLGAGLLALAFGRRRLAPVLGLAVLLINLVPLVGFLYGINDFYGMAHVTGIAWPTVAALLALGVGLIVAVPEAGPMALLLRDDPGGALLRRLLPAALLLPLGLGWMMTAGGALGFYDLPTGRGLMVVSLTVLFSALLWRSAARMSHEAAARRRAEDQNNRLAQQRQLALDAARMGWWHYDPATRIATWDDRYREIFGVSDNQRPYDEILTRLHPDDVPLVRAAVAAALGPADPKPYSIEFRINVPNGPVRWIEAHGMPVFEGVGRARRAASLIGTVTDVTERKRAEEAQRQTIAALERSNRELEQFAYVCAHDLQEPLRQVRAFVNLFKERHGGALDEQASQYFAFIYDGAKRMTNLVSGLLEYAHTASREAHREPLSAGQALEIALADLHAAITETHARLTHDDLPTVTADRGQLIQLFLNLVDNALKFHRDGVPPEVHVGCRRDGRQWLFWVKDNGIGIAPAYHEKVFLIFQRLHGHEAYPGTGMGLALCKKIVEQHGGRIWIESALGEGATFYFTLPEASGG